MSNSKFPASKIFLALQEISRFLDQHRIQYCLIGGLAVQLRAEPRFTRDIDLCLATSLDKQHGIIELVLKAFKPKVSNARDLALSTQILPILVHDITTDLALGLTGFEASVVNRANLELLGDDFRLPVCSSEDLIIYKVLAARPKDIQDIEMIVARAGDKLDLVYLENTLQEFEAALARNDLLSLLKRFI